MDIIGIIVNLVSGAVGGNIAGATLKEKTLGTLGNTIAGAIGGTAGAWILQMVGVLNSMGMGDMTLGTLAGGAATSVVGGGIITGIIGMLKGKS